MDRNRRIVATCALAGVLLVAFEFAPALLLDFARDDFELYSMARIGGFAPAALFLPHRGIFLKPVMNVTWALLVALLGARPAVWHLVALGVHLTNAALLGLLAKRLADAWCDPPAGRRSRSGTSLSPPSPGTPLGEDPSQPPDPARGPLAVAPQPESVRSSSRYPLALVTGLVTALLWSVHDRLAEPLFSISSLNHSLTFSFYLAALLLFARALSTGKPRDRLLTAGLSLLALFSYEVAFSLILALPLMAFLGRRSARGSAPKTLLPVLALSAGPYVVIQAMVRLAPGMGSYYAASAPLAAHNLSETWLAFLHIRTDWIAPGPAAAAILAAGLAALFAFVSDPLIRFGIGWSLLASLPVLAIPVFSDRYHYIVFAGLAMASGRALASLLAPGVGPRLRAIPAVLASALVAAHLLWSVAGAREQAPIYALRGWSAELLLREAGTIAAGPAAVPGRVLVLAWWGEPDLTAQLLDLYLTGEGKRLEPFDADRFRSWPFASCRLMQFSPARPGRQDLTVFVRPEGVLGAVYPADLLNVAGASRGIYFRVPEPGVAASALLEGKARLEPLGLFVWGKSWRPDLAPVLLERARQTMLEDRSIPTRIEVPGAALPSGLRIAYLEGCTRSDAFAAEYAPLEGPGAVPPPAAP